MAILLSELLEKIPPEVERRVRKVRDQSRSVIQEALRTECRLSMRTAEEAEENRAGAQVPIEIIPGHPIILNGISFSEDVEITLILSRYRKALLQAKESSCDLSKMLDERPALSQASESIIDKNIFCDINTWSSNLLSYLDKNDPLKSIMGVNEDFLGVYQYEVGSSLFDEDTYINKATIHIYWAVVGLVSEWMGCSIEDLTLVVLTHELAHAYTQLGADIEGRRWPSWHFQKSEVSLKEGLAQYYTERVLGRLERRYPTALQTFKSMLEGQSEPYRAHVSWLQHGSPESVRRAMLEVRRWRESTLMSFKNRLEEAHNQLHPKH